MNKLSERYNKIRARLINRMIEKRAILEPEAIHKMTPEQLEPHLRAAYKQMESLADLADEREAQLAMLKQKPENRLQPNSPVIAEAERGLHKMRTMHHELAQKIEVAKTHYRTLTGRDFTLGRQAGPGSSPSGRADPVKVLLPGEIPSERVKEKPTGRKTTLWGDPVVRPKTVKEPTEKQKETKEKGLEQARRLMEEHGQPTYKHPTKQDWSLQPPLMEEMEDGRISDSRREALKKMHSRLDKLHALEGVLKAHMLSNDSPELRAKLEQVLKDKKVIENEIETKLDTLTPSEMQARQLRRDEGMKKMREEEAQRQGKEYTEQTEYQPGEASKYEEFLQSQKPEEAELKGTRAEFPSIPGYDIEGLAASDLQVQLLDKLRESLTKGVKDPLEKSLVDQMVSHLEAGGEVSEDAQFIEDNSRLQFRTPSGLPQHASEVNPIIAGVLQENSVRMQRAQQLIDSQLEHARLLKKEVAAPKLTPRERRVKEEDFREYVRKIDRTLALIFTSVRDSLKTRVLNRVSAQTTTVIEGNKMRTRVQELMAAEPTIKAKIKAETDPVEKRRLEKQLAELSKAKEFFLDRLSAMSKGRGTGVIRREKEEPDTFQPKFQGGTGVSEKESGEPTLPTRQKEHARDDEILPPRRTPEIFRRPPPKKSSIQKLFEKVAAHRRSRESEKERQDKLAELAKWDSLLTEKVQMMIGGKFDPQKIKPFAEKLRQVRDAIKKLQPGPGFTAVMEPELTKREIPGVFRTPHEEVEEKLKARMPRGGERMRTVEPTELLAAQTRAQELLTAAEAKLKEMLAAGASPDEKTRQVQLVERLRSTVDNFEPLADRYQKMLTLEKLLKENIKLQKKQNDPHLAETEQKLLEVDQALGKMERLLQMSARHVSEEKMFGMMPGTQRLPAGQDDFMAWKRRTPGGKL